MLTLGIETSCDETAAAVVCNKEVLSNAVSSSIRLHSRFGGVVPEIASRYHVEYIGYCIWSALKKAGVGFGDLELVSVTQGPGLMGSLLVGVSAAKAISLSLNIPIVAVNHVTAHLFSNFLNGANLKYPFVGVVISGGHTSIFYVKSVLDSELLGQTNDDACGESFDKVAKILNLGYPGGPVIEKRAEKGNPKKINFPRSYLGDSLDFSFSGIKTAVLYYVREKEKKGLRKSDIDDIAASFQEAAFDVIVKKAILACERKKCSTLAVGGGVSINKRLRAKLGEEARLHNIKAHFPEAGLCLDNAAMVAYAGQLLFEAGKRSSLDFGAFQYCTDDN